MFWKDKRIPRLSSCQDNSELHFPVAGSCSHIWVIWYLLPAEYIICKLLLPGLGFHIRTVANMSYDHHCSDSICICDVSMISVFDFITYECIVVYSIAYLYPKIHLRYYHICISKGKKTSFINRVGTYAYHKLFTWNKIHTHQKFKTNPTTPNKLRQNIILCGTYVHIYT